MSTPKLSAGQFEYAWHILDSAPIQCTLDYSPAGGDGYHEPRYGADCTLTAAFVGDVDILPILSDDQRRDIECSALESHEQECAAAADEAAIQRHQDMLDNYDASELA